MAYLGEEIKKLGFGLMRLPMKGDAIDLEQTKAMVDSTFISRPMGPVSLTVNISITEVTREMHRALRGPYRKPPMAMTMSFGS